jgi:hypothetical protein
MLQVNVGNDGSVKLKRVEATSGIELPTATRTRKADKAMYPFNTMAVGDSFPVANQKAATAAQQAFKSAIYEAARKVGKLRTLSLKKHPEVRAMFAKTYPDVTEDSYGVWMVANPAEAPAEGN